MYFFKNRLYFVFFLLFSSALLKYGLTPFISGNNPVPIRIVSSILIMFFGAFFILKKTADTIEETTDVLHERTKIAGGVLQSFGTAFPDMVLGVVAAITSLKLRSTDYALAVNFAIIAAATTFGSNIYNIGHAIWCVYRQNLSSRLNREILMFPHFPKWGSLKPIKNHKIKPSVKELDTAVDVLVALTVLTLIVSVSMVVFGKETTLPNGLSGDLYQLIKPVGILIFALSVVTVYYFRKSKREAVHTNEAQIEEKFYRNKSSLIIWLSLLISGISILLAAESMVHAIQVISEISGTPVVIAGVLAGIIGCLGEIIVVHNFSVHPKGRIGDAIVGVAMDNIVTIMGASVVAIMGGIFLGGNALILIFVTTLSLNTILIWQIGKTKNYLLS